MKKRFLAWIMAVCMIVSLAACGGNTSSDQADASAKDGTVVVNGMELGAGLVEEEEAAAELDENPDRAIDRAVEPIKPIPDTMLDGTLLTDDFYYYRSTLGTMEQQAYDLLRAGILEGDSEIKMTVPISPDDIFEVYKKVLYDSPELFWAEINGAKYAYNNKGQVTKFLPSYNALAGDIEGSVAKLEAATKDALADMWSLSTDAEKAKYAHDWLTYHVTYNLNAAHNQTSYSALVNYSTVCAGYAHGFQYMMQQVGIPCAYVLGYGMDQYHAWNVVKLDGEHYAMDVTWDDPTGAKPNTFYYNYFNITDQKIGSDHTRAAVSESVPMAQGTNCSYQNAFGGNAAGTDFDAIQGVLPEKKASGGGNNAEGNPYL